MLLKRKIKPNFNPAEELIKLEKEWKTCQRCPLGEFSKHHVLYDRSLMKPLGNLKADILIIGEGPGEAEDSLGRPFVGPAGRLLREALIESGVVELNILLTNLVACRPFDKSDSGRKENRAPNPDEVLACQPRLIKTLKIFRPKVVVSVGAVPMAWGNDLLRHILVAKPRENYSRPNLVSITQKHLYHPSYILRKGGVGSPEYKKYVDEWKEVKEEAQNETKAKEEATTYY